MILLTPHQGFQLLNSAVFSSWGSSTHPSSFFGLPLQLPFLIAQKYGPLPLPSLTELIFPGILCPLWCQLGRSTHRGWSSRLHPTSLQGRLYAWLCARPPGEGICICFSCFSHFMSISRHPGYGATYVDQCLSDPLVPHTFFSQGRKRPMTHCLQYLVLRASHQKSSVSNSRFLLFVSCL